jgi:hypothetical protein
MREKLLLCGKKLLLIQCSLLFFKQKYVCIYRGEVVWEMARLGKAKTPQGDQEA